MNGSRMNRVFRIVLIGVFCQINFTQSCIAINAPQDLKNKHIRQSKTPIPNTTLTKDDLIGKETSKINEESIKRTLPISKYTALASAMSSGAATSGPSLPENLSNYFNFDSFSGSAALSLPIETIPGRKGIAPSINLTYSPRNPNGPMGVGWNVSFPAIERSTKNGLPNYSDNDSFISTLGGSRQELISTSPNVYHAQVQGNFTKYIFNGKTWEAHDPLGNIYYFGLAALLEDQSLDEDNGRIFRWKLSEMKDINGNYYYIRHFQYGGFEILYTGEPGTDRDILNNVSHNFYARIIGEMESTIRPDILLENNAGFSINNSYRLKNISIFANSQLQRRYQFEYKQSRHTGRSILSRINTYGSDNISTLPPITFNYDDQPPQYSIFSVTGEPTTGDNLWSVRSDLSYDYGHECYGVCNPQTMCYGVQWEKPITTLSGNYGCNSWTGNGRGSFRLIGCQDNATLFSTYVYLREPKSFTVNYLAGDSSHGIFINGDYTPRPILSSQIWNLKAGYNLIEVTNYHQHQSYWFDLNFNLAENVDLMNSSQVIQPQFSADFNGDGLSDTATFFSDSGSIKVALSNGNSFLPKTEWFTGIFSNLKITIGDFNADGRADIAGFDSVKGEWKVALSDGSKFILSGIWITNFGPNSQPSSGDINGDRYTDAITFTSQSGMLYANYALNKNNSFVPQNENIALGDDSVIPLTGDFNGDGLTDFAGLDNLSGTWKFYINQGGPDKGFLLSNTITDFGANFIPIISDLNSDGLTDIGYFDINNGKIFFRTSETVKFSESKELPLIFELKSPSTQIQTGDFNGDGLNDFFLYNPLAQQQIALSNGIFTDLLTEYNNGIGGKTRMAYKGSSSFANSYLPFNMPVLNKVEIDNSRGEIYRFTYNYEGGLWDTKEKEFMGFAKVNVFDYDNNKSETKFLQDNIYTRGLPVLNSFFDAANNIYTKTINTWSTEQVFESAPSIKLVKLNRVDNFIYNKDGTGIRTAVVNEYSEVPQYGNRTKTIKLGEVDFLSGADIGSDSLINEISFHNKSTDKFQLLGLPKSIINTNHTGTVLSTAWIYYDNNPDWSSPPIKGHLTKTKLWAGSDSGHPDPENKIEYDLYGNIVSTTSPLGHISKIFYDDKWNVLPIKTENALGQTISTEYYGIAGIPTDSGNGIKGLWGQSKSIIDMNGQTDLKIYDQFGRNIAYVSPLDSLDYPTTKISVDNFDTFSRTITQQRINKGTEETIKTVNFYDSFGRLIQTKSQTQDPNKFILSGQTENGENGLPRFKYLPRFSTNSQDLIDPIDTAKPRVSIEYDPLNRPIKVINADSAYSTYEYGARSKIFVDPNGHKTESILDIFGRLIEKRDFTGSDGRYSLYPAQPYTTYAVTKYSYDDLGHLSAIADEKGNITTISYDTLGRKKSMNDPDMGNWRYEFDAEGNLKRQIDAKGQTIEYSYDPLNRLANKTDHDKLNVTYIYDDPSIPFSKGKVSFIQYNGDSVSFEYDQLGREKRTVKTIDGKAYPVERNYDHLNNVIEIKYPDGEIIFYQYDLGGMPGAVSNDKSLLPSSSSNQPDGLSFKRAADATGKLLSYIFNKWIEPYVLGIGYAEAGSGYTMTPNATVISSVIPGDKKITLSWKPVSNTTGYNVDYGTQTGKYTTTINVNLNTSYVVTGLSNGIKYYLRVRPYNKYGPSIYQAQEVSATPTNIIPPIPPTLSLPKVSDNTIALTWSSITGTTGYKIFAGTSSQNYTQVILPGNVTSYTLNNLTPGFTYYFAVSAINSAGESKPSNEQNVRIPFPQPDAPVLLNATESEGAVKLVWSASNNATGYKIKYGIQSGEHPDIIDAGNVYERSVSGLQINKRYFFIITAYNNDSESIPSNELTAVPFSREPAAYVKNTEYNAAGQITKIEYGNGDITIKEYSSLNSRLSRLHTVNKAGSPLQDLNYQYDAVGNILKITDLVNSASQEFKYDHLNRLKEAKGNYGVKTFSYDELGNIINKDTLLYNYDGIEAGPHAVTSLSNNSKFYYDLNGNMSRRVNSDSNTSFYKYNNENRLVSVEKDGQIIALFAYDGDGGRIKSEINNITTRYVGSIFEDNDFGIARHIFFGSQRLATIRNEKPLYYHSDHLGGINVLTDSTGEIKELFEYYPFGTTSRHESYGYADEKTSFNFTGKMFDESTGLYFYNARYYDPQLGRFITPDRIVQNPSDPQSLNRYSYCSNNPVNNIDPTGNSWLKNILNSVGNFFDSIFHWLEKATNSKWYYDIKIGQTHEFEDAETFVKTSARVVQTAAIQPWQIGIGAMRWAHESKFAILENTSLGIFANSNIIDGDYLFINGITNSINTAFENANKAYPYSAVKVAYNPTDGVLADITEAFLQKFFLTSSFDRQLADALTGHKNITLAGHSQGAIIESNTLLNLGLRGERSAVHSARFINTQISAPRAYMSAILGGVEMKHITYGSRYFDPSNVAGPNFTEPLKLLSGIPGLYLPFGVQYHGIE